MGRLRLVLLQIGFHLIRRADQELIADGCLRRVNGTGWQLQDTRTVLSNGSDPKCAKRLDQMYNAILRIQIDQVDRKQHTDRVNPLRGNYPNPLVGSQPKPSD